MIEPNISKTDFSAVESSKETSECRNIGRRSGHILMVESRKELQSEFKVGTRGDS